MRITLQKLLVLAITFSFITFACQEGNLAEDELDQLDEDMLAAVEFADDYLTSTNGRINSVEKSVTVFKYENGQLLFKTAGDTTAGYKPVTEETVTAEAEPGDYLFWYSGGGVTDLEGIDFDAASEAALHDLPDEINPDKMWVIQVPEDIEEGTEYLKYDIVYDFEGNAGPIIRLDPKITIGRNSVSVGDDGTEGE
ncbi:hypothetical protein [Ekhidna sp.]